ncbi:putative ABC transporter ATP-binding protein [Dirofilaria immitis]
MLKSYNFNDVKKDNKITLFSAPITIWMYILLVLFLTATMVICIRGLIDYGFTLDSIPNFLLIIVLLIVSIINVFTITIEKKLFIIPLNGMIIASAVLTAFVFFYRIYVFKRDSGKDVSELFWSAITYAIILALHGFAFYIINSWKRIIKKRNKK